MASTDDTPRMLVTTPGNGSRGHVEHISYESDVWIDGQDRFSLECSASVVLAEDEATFMVDAEVLGSGVGLTLTAGTGSIIGEDEDRDIHASLLLEPDAAEELGRALIASAQEIRSGRFEQVSLPRWVAEQRVALGQAR